ncbi:MAG: pectate lyase [Acidobacteria bacterium]|nr:pectate lyase [Acidobacteriota bacterium]MCW5948339.1 pectate lyase [Pyrinomonadaceae bacterium]
MKAFLTLLTTAWLSILVTAATGYAADIVVAADGTGDTRSVQAAIDRVPQNNGKRFVIEVRPGVYREQVRIPANKPFISLIGSDAAKTVITYGLSNKDAGSTSASYSFYVGGHDLRAENITFENSYGQGSQAVAALVEADRAVFRKCRFIGWQDTLYAKSGRQYYDDCYIEGHVDFIFGQAAAYFNNCQIHSKADGYITAPMRFAADEPSGLVFNKCRLTSSDTKYGVYLGRPWRDYGRAVFINTQMDADIRPEGWHHWEPQRERTAYMAEYGSTGRGAQGGSRVAWAKKLSDADIKAFSLEYFLGGRDGWDPATAKDEWLVSHRPENAAVGWSDVLKQPAHWYAVDEATRIANQVLVYQRANGGWEKNVDMATMLTQAERTKLIAERSSSDTTIDNGATTTQLKFLARVITAKNIEAHRDAFNRGLDFLLSMQYENGGFPQFYPLRGDYSREITLNDNAMVNALELLRDVARRRPEYTFVDDARRQKAEDAVRRGTAMLLKLQVKIDGKLTIWAAQYDEKSLQPAWARKFEPPSLTAGESVAVVRYLMGEERTPETVAAIEAAIAWYERNKLTGIRWERVNGENTVVKDAKAPPIWARFYELRTMRPIFIGRDSVIRYSVAEIEPERRNGYAWYVDSPRDLLEKRYPEWRSRTENAR